MKSDILALEMDLPTREMPISLKVIVDFLKNLQALAADVSSHHNILFKLTITWNLITLFFSFVFAYSFFILPFFLLHKFIFICQQTKAEHKVKIYCTAKSLIFFICYIRSHNCTLLLKFIDFYLHKYYADTVLSVAFLQQ